MYKQFPRVLGSKPFWCMMACIVGPNIVHQKVSHNVRKSTMFIIDNVLSSVTCLQLNMQEEDIIEHDNDKHHVSTIWYARGRY